jgi:peptidoglycan/xylan/chitin deacetylase (PgdA/CDA1 family)
MNPKEKAVYITFDDGPIPEATPWVLDILDQYGVKATFFMVGDNVRKYPELFEEVKRRGHRVGNHTYNHITLLMHSKDYVWNVHKADRLIQSKLFRPPHGWMLLAQYAWLSRKYKVVMWDLVTRDYSKWMTARGIVNNVKRYARPGSIITFHDSLKSIEKLHFALPESIKWLEKHGYEFKTFA